jgi:Na+/proline symporter
MFAAIRRGDFGAHSQGLIVQLLIQMASALLLTWFVLQTTRLSYARRIGFLTIAGLAAGVIADLPNWNWWGFSGKYTADRRPGHRQSC